MSPENSKTHKSGSWTLHPSCFAAAFAAALAAPSSADADIIYSGNFGLINLPIPASSALGLYLDVDGMAYAVGAGLPGADINFFNTLVGANQLSFFGNLGGNSNRAVLSAGGVAKLGSGSTVSVADSFGVQSLLATHQPGSTSNGNWAGGGTGFVGFSFKVGANTHYGWARLNINAGTLDGTVVDFAYDNTANAPIRTGAIPEPTSIALLALGAVGVIEIRRRSRAKREQAG